MWLNYLLSTKNHATPFRSSFMCDYSFRFISCILYSILFYYIIHTCMQCSSAFINYLGWRTFARVIYIYVCICMHVWTESHFQPVTVKVTHHLWYNGCIVFLLHKWMNQYEAWLHHMRNNILCYNTLIAII